MDVREQLEESVGTGEILTILYHGGSQPGATRQISPIKVEGDKVRARCYTSGAVKVFKLDKIEIQPSSNLTSYEDLSNTGALDSLESFTQHYLPAFQARGWTIVQDKDSLALFDHFKNGKPRKTSALSISYQPTYTETNWLSDNQEQIIYQREKPWCISSRSTSSQFKNLQKALTKFLLLEQELSPE